MVLDVRCTKTHPLKNSRTSYIQLRTLKLIASVSLYTRRFFYDNIRSIQPIIWNILRPKFIVLHVS
jgi:hypothetical protein